MSWAAPQRRLFGRLEGRRQAVTLFLHDDPAVAPSALFAPPSLDPLAPAEPLPVAPESAGRQGHDDDGLGESFRTLRAHLLTHVRRGARSFLLTSARPQEGKTTIAAHLAGSLAVGGRAVLLVDGDLRRPRVHQIFGLSNAIGFADLLAGSVPLTAAAQPLRSGLSVLTSGTVSPDPQALLLNGTLETALSIMERTFDVVLIDSAPVLSVTDAELLAAQVDGVLVVIRAGVPTVADMRLLRERLTRAGAPVIGSVMSHCAGDAAAGYHPYATDLQEA